MYLKLFVLVLLINAASANNHADSTFAMKLEKCELAQFNPNWIQDAHISCDYLNATHFKIDASGRLLKEANFDNVTATGQVYLFDGHTYVIQPQLKLTLPICDEYNRETFGYWKDIEHHGNIKGCGLHKPDMYEVKDFVPRMRITDIPPLTKEDKVKLNVQVNLGTEQLYAMDFYVTVAPKA